MCLYPVNILNPNLYAYSEAYNNKWITFDEYKKHVRFSVPCGKCFECRMKFSKEWSFRCYYEAMQHEQNCSVTFTYKETDGELNKKDIQKLFKDLRNRGVKFRYFGCGEYGEKGGRPHYHVCFFGWQPGDLEFFKMSKKGHNPLYKSRFLEKIWKHGYVLVEAFSLESARYASLYLQKFNKTKDKKVQPFRLCSRKPAIGTLNFDYETALKSDKIYANGKYIPLPRIYLRKGLALGFDEVNDVKTHRVETAERFADSTDFDAYQARLDRASRYRYCIKKRSDVKLIEDSDIEDIEFPLITSSKTSAPSPTLNIVQTSIEV